MCGICGKFTWDGTAVPPDLIQQICQTMEHRGPDDQGIYCKDNIGLGHRRLSILDLSPAGHQPMQRGHLWLIFNGEIYNYLELRRELELSHKPLSPVAADANLAPSHASSTSPSSLSPASPPSHHQPESSIFCTQTDSEVVLAWYEKEGPACLSRFRGMFAFAIWDDQKQTLFLARDRVGKKPLYYHQNSHGFTFASCLRALLKDTSIQRNIQPLALHHYLTYQYVPYPLTIWDGIYQIPPAHFMLVHANGNIEIQRYWDLHYHPKFLLRHPEQENELEQLLWNKLTEAVQIRLRSDVPLGAFLSGGLDSSLVVALMTKLLGKSMKTFAIGFEQPEYNELAFARQVAQHCQTEHYEQVVRAEDAAQILPELVRHYEEPYADSSAIPCFLVSQLARKHVTVVLSGDGGDESFAGYDRYRFGKTTALLQTFFPRFLAKFGLLSLSCLPFSQGSKGLFAKAERFLQGYSLRFPDTYALWMSHFSNDMKAQLYTPEWEQQLLNTFQQQLHQPVWQQTGHHAWISQFDSLALTRQAYFHNDAHDVPDRLMAADVALYLPNDLLTKMDVATMAYGLESRSPWLDHQLMELAASLPSHWKLRGNQSKWILKKLAAQLLPHSIIHRPKMGFGIPLSSWLRTTLSPLLHDVLGQSQFATQGYFQQSYIFQLMAQHTQGIRNWQYPLYNLLMLELWFREFMQSATLP